MSEAIRKNDVGLHEAPESSRGCTAGEPSRNHDRGSSVSATRPELGEAVPLPPADWQAPQGRGGVGGEQRAHTAAARIVKRPEAYTCPQARSACRTLADAAVRQHAAGLHHLALNDREFMHMVSAVERARDKTRKAIGKGLAEAGDLRATDSLWEKLQLLRAYRQFGRRA